MKALISGQAALALTLDAPYQIRALDSTPKMTLDREVALRLFEGCSDLEEVSASTLDEIDALTEQAWAKDRAVRLFLFLIDPHEPADDLREYAECVEELIGTPAVREHLQWTLASGPLPLLVEVKRVREAIRGLAGVDAVFQELLGLQGVLVRLQEQFGRVRDDMFDGERARAQLWSSLVRDGSIFSLATRLQSGQDISFLRLEIAHRHPGQHNAITQWTAMLQSGIQKPTRQTQAVVDEDDGDWSTGESEAPGNSRAAFEQVRAQQAHIIEQLKHRRLEDARRFTELLIEHQRSNSSAEQIAKSLSLLAQQAKLQEVPELQLEWAEWAARENPVDPKTFGHLADALITIGRYSEAEAALDAVEAAGGRLFSEGGRARILSAVGRFDEARAKLLAAAHEFENQEGVELCWAHAADCLRDLGHSDQAVGEYQELTKRFALIPEIWSGYAYALLDIGRIDEAITNFGRSLANSRRNPWASNGRAAAYKQAGRFAEAQEIYGQVIADFPNNSTALCGSAEVFRLKGQFDAALEAYDIAIERCPFSVYPYSGKAYVLLEMGERQKARDLFELTYRKFPSDAGAMTGFIKASAALGRYQEALTSADEYLQQAPRSINVRLQRAKILFRMGQEDAALIALDILSREHPSSISVTSAKASLLISANKIDEAALLLPDNLPKTQPEWNRYLLRLLVLESQVGKGAASGRLHRALNACPFFAQRKLLRSALVRLEISRGRAKDARRIVESAPTEVSNVISFHAFAAAHRSGHARKIYEEIIGSDAAPLVISLTEEIARRTGIINETPRQTEQWIAEQERIHLLAEAV